MAVIYKYPIPRVSEPFELKIKGFCEVVDAGVDGNGQPCIWALVTPDNLEETWTFCVVATGESFDTSQWSHLKTFNQGALVWHLLRPVDDWNRAAPVADAPIGRLVYVIGPRIEFGRMPDLSLMTGRFYNTYQAAEAAFNSVDATFDQATHAIFSVHAVIQQETTFEALF